MSRLVSLRTQVSEGWWSGHHNFPEISKSWWTGYGNFPEVSESWWTGYGDFRERAESSCTGSSRPHNDNYLATPRLPSQVKRHRFGTPRFQGTNRTSPIRYATGPVTGQAIQIRHATGPGKRSRISQGHATGTGTLQAYPMGHRMHLSLVRGTRDSELWMVTPTNRDALPRRVLHWLSARELKMSSVGGGLPLGTPPSCLIPTDSVPGEEDRRAAQGPVVIAPASGLESGRPWWPPFLRGHVAVIIDRPSSRATRSAGRSLLEKREKVRVLESGVGLFADSPEQVYQCNSDSYWG